MKFARTISGTSVFRKLIRYGLMTFAWVIGLTVLLWVILWIYVGLNEESLIRKVSTAIHEKTRGEVKIGGLSVSFFRTFPILSLQLSEVVIRDSIYAVHHKDFLTASDVYLRASVPGLILGKSPIGKVIVRNGEINLISDSLGRDNKYILKATEKIKSDKKVSMPVVVLRNMLANYEEPLRNKHHSAIIENIKCSMKERNGLLEVDMNLRMLVKNLGFNTLKGAYLKEKIVEGKFGVTYNKNNNEILVNNIRLDLDNHPFYFNGKFNTDKNNADFNLTINTRKINFSKAAAFLSDSIRKKVDLHAFTKTVDLNVKLSGKALYKYVPVVEVNLDVKNNKVITPNGMFEDCTFKAFFSNEKILGKPRDDVNSYIQISDFSGRWEKILLSSKSIIISNLIKPFLECDIASDIDMKSLNKLAGSNTLEFLSGKTSINVVFKGPVNGDDSTASNLNGEINFYDASIKYKPRDFLLSDCEGNLKFINNDLFVKKFTATAGKTRLVMSASAKNFLSMLNVSPEKLVLNWKISSPELHLSDFKGFLSKAEVKKGKDKEAKLSGASARIDKMFTDGDVYISLETPAMDYKTFRATNVKANVVLTASEIKLEQGALNHAGGTVNVSGTLKNGVLNNPLTLHVRMQNMDIPLLFAAFNNFGQDALTHKNLKGKLSAAVDFRSAITSKAELATENSEGIVQFLLQNGELNNFEPLQEIGKKAFKKQDFTQIKFADLKNRLDVKGTTFIVNPMDIRSTALNFSVEGVYDFKKGTDMSIKLPIRNLMNSQARTDISDEGKVKKGMSLRLRAKTGEDGKLKVSWDPFRLAIKNKKGVKDSTGLKN